MNASRDKLGGELSALTLQPQTKKAATLVLEGEPIFQGWSPNVASYDALGWGRGTSELDALNQLLTELGK
jgi:hypothetical protein